MNLEVMKEILISKGYKCDLANGGHKAIEMIKERRDILATNMQA